MADPILRASCKADVDMVLTVLQVQHSQYVNTVLLEALLATTLELAQQTPIRDREQLARMIKTAFETERTLSNQL